MNNKELIKQALQATRKTREQVDSGMFSKLMGCVGAALETSNGEVFTGICMEFYCSLGFCAEHSAASEMVKNGYSEIKKMVAVTFEGKVISPCGRCREMMFQLNKENLKTEVILSEDKVCQLERLLPDPWQDNFDASLL